MFLPDAYAYFKLSITITHLFYRTKHLLSIIADKTVQYWSTILVLFGNFRPDLTFMYIFTCSLRGFFMILLWIKYKYGSVNFSCKDSKLFKNFPYPHLTKFHPWNMCKLYIMVVWQFLYVYVVLNHMKRYQRLNWKLGVTWSVCFVTKRACFKLCWSESVSQSVLL